MIKFNEQARADGGKENFRQRYEEQTTTFVSLFN